MGAIASVSPPHLNMAHMVAPTRKLVWNIYAFTRLTAVAPEPSSPLFAGRHNPVEHGHGRPQSPNTTQVGKRSIAV